MSTTERFCKPRVTANSVATSTRFLYVAGVGSDVGSDVEKIRAFFATFGELDDNLGGVDMVPNRRYCYVCYLSANSAEKALSFMSSDACTPEHMMSTLGVTKIIVKYAVEKVTNPSTASQIECTHSERNVGITVPGCYLIADYISVQDEQALLTELAGPDAPWKETLSRRVQHYGFPFNYRTLMLDYNKPTPPLPATCVSLTERFAATYRDILRDPTRYALDNTVSVESMAENSDTCECVTNGAGAGAGTAGDGTTATDTKASTSEVLPINQLTINEYLPGQGIAPHTDTESCLGPEIFILNLGSDIVMTLYKNEPAGPTETAGAADGVASDGAGDSSSGELELRKHLHLPARSLLILSGEARYGWSHGIAQRRSDKIQGNLVPRQRRVSLTFRQALKPGAVPASLLQPGELELDHVVRVYDNIAIHWNHTRGKRKVYWHRVKQFLDALPVGTLLADIGSGDGKYFGVNPGVITVGCDRSLKLLEVSSCRENETFCCDAVKLPLTSDSFDATLCIAVLHHLSTVDRRYAVISELLRITKIGGYVMIQAWALEQGGDSKRIFESQDTMVPWRLSKRFLSEAQQQQLLNPAGSNTAGNPAADDATAADPAGVAVAQEDGSPAAHSTEETATESSTPNNTSRSTFNATTSFTDSGPCQHVTEDAGELVFQRYCHVYKEGELEALCSSIPGCVVVESGWDKGNWFVQLMKVREDRLDVLPAGPEGKIPVLASRNK